MTVSLPYPEPGGMHTAGHAGTDTSRDRAVREALSGAAGALQEYIIDQLKAAGRDGLTIKDFRDTTPGKHHGSLSGGLSVLHTTNRIAMLEDSWRDNCRVYVHLDHVGSQKTLAKGRKRKGEGEDTISMEYDAGYEAGKAEAMVEFEETQQRVYAEGFEAGITSVREAFEKWLSDLQ